jgi:hypothetical protein
MFPERPLDSKAHSEREVFASLRDTLSDDYAVFHGVMWHRPGRKPDGELDFLIAHPQLGLLALEVKGGGITFDPRSGWFTTNSHGIVSEINDPYQQAVTSKHAVLKDLKADPRWPPRTRVQIGHAVCFPAVAVNSDFGHAGKRIFTFGRDDLPKLGSHIEACLRYWQDADAADPPGPHGFEAILERYGRSWHYRVPLKDELAEAQQRIIELTSRQMEALRILSRQTRAAIGGCAGSGKSLLAIARARELAGEGKAVLLTCFNRALAEHWNATLDLPPGVTASHFHQVCARAVRTHGIAPPSGTNYIDWLPTGLLEASTAADGPRFDAIVVDEGQDFSAEWLEILECLLRDDASRYVVFFDDNQRLYLHGNIPASFGTTFPLDRNVRNTNEIGAIVQEFYSGTMQLSGVHGDRVRFVAVEAEDEGAALADLLARLRSRGADPSDVVVLTPGSVERSDLLQRRRFGKWSLRTRSESDGDVLIETIHSFKGQDRAVVILAELHRLAEMRTWNADAVTTLLYVGCSRATQLLIVLGSDLLREPLVKLGAVVTAAGQAADDAVTRNA